MSAFMPDTGWSGWFMSEMFINLTKEWIPLEIVTGMMFTGESVGKPEEISYPVFTDEFMEFAKIMKEWDTKGYWSKDVLSNTAQPSNEFLAGKTAAYFQHAQGYIGTYGNILESLPTAIRSTIALARPEERSCSSRPWPMPQASAALL